MDAALACLATGQVSGKGGHAKCICFKVFLKEAYLYYYYYYICAFSSFLVRTEMVHLIPHQLVANKNIRDVSSVPGSEIANKSQDTLGLKP